MPIQITWRKGATDLPIADWNDVITGAAYKRFWPCISDLTGGDVYVLATSVVDGKPYFETINYTTGAYVLGMDKDFDINVVTPFEIEAQDCVINITHGADAGGQYDQYFVMTIYHVDSGASETSIGTATTPARLGTQPEYEREMIRFTLTKTKFKKGEKLRVNIKHYGKHIAPAITAKVYLDPTSQQTLTDVDGRTIGTDCTVDIPFVLPKE